MLAEGRSVPNVAMTVTFTITYTMTTAVLFTGSSNSTLVQAVHVPTVLLVAHPVLPTSCPIRNQRGLFGVTQIDECCVAFYHLPPFSSSSNSFLSEHPQPKLKPVVIQLMAEQQPAHNVTLRTLPEAMSITIIPTVCILRPVDVHLVARIIRSLPGRSPQQPALIVPRSTLSITAVRFTIRATLRIPPEDIPRTMLRTSRTVLWQIALRMCRPTNGRCLFQLTTRQITTLSSRTNRSALQSTELSITTRIITGFFHATVTLFSLFNESVATTRRINHIRTILQAMVQSPTKRQR